MIEKYKSILFVEKDVVFSRVPQEFKNIIVTHINIKDGTDVDVNNSFDFVINNRDFIYGWRSVSLNKEEISEIIERNRLKLTIPFGYYDEFYQFLKSKKTLLIEKYKIERNHSIVLNIKEVVMKTGNKYFIISN